MCGLFCDRSVCCPIEDLWEHDRLHRELFHQPEHADDCIVFLGGSSASQVCWILIIVMIPFSLAFFGTIQYTSSLHKPEVKSKGKIAAQFILPETCVVSAKDSSWIHSRFAQTRGKLKRFLSLPIHSLQACSQYTPGSCKPSCLQPKILPRFQ